MCRQFNNLCSIGIINGYFLLFVRWLSLGLASLGVAQAQIIPDASAPESQQAVILPTSSGAIQVNIQSPNASGVSMNQFQQFDVGSKGAVLANNRQATKTQIAGWVSANPYMARGEADVIVNQVNSHNPSQLNGYVEVAGKRADVIIANPSGIAVNGAGFLNANRTILSTGKVQFNNGQVTGYDISQGHIQISGKGLDVRDGNYTALLSRSAAIHADIHQGDGKLDVITGVNQVDASGNITISNKPPGDGKKPTVAIDTGHLGGMYAGSIRLLVTEKGVGVNHAGVIQTNQLTLSANGELRNTGTINAGRFDVDSESLHNKGDLHTVEQLDLTVNHLENSGRITSGRLAIDTDVISNSGRIEQAGQALLTIKTPRLNNRSSGRIGVAASTTTSQAGTANTTAQHIPGHITAKQSIDNSGSINASGAIDTQVNQSLHNEGEIVVNQLTVKGATFDNQQTLLAEALLVDNEQVKNTGQLVTGQADITTKTLTNQQVMYSRGNQHLRAEQLDNTGIIQSQAGLDIDAKRLTSTHTIQGDKVSIKTDEHLTLTGGVIQGTASVSIQSQGDINLLPRVDVKVSESSDNKTYTNAAGHTVIEQTQQKTTDTIYTGAEVRSDGNITLMAGGGYSQRGGVVASKEGEVLIGAKHYEITHINDSRIQVTDTTRITTGREVEQRSALGDSQAELAASTAALNQSSESRVNELAQSNKDYLSQEVTQIPADKDRRTITKDFTHTVVTKTQTQDETARNAVITGDQVRLLANDGQTTLRGVDFDGRSQTVLEGSPRVLAAREVDQSIITSTEKYRANGTVAYADGRTVGYKELGLTQRNESQTTTTQGSEVDVEYHLQESDQRLAITEGSSGGTRIDDHFLQVEKLSGYPSMKGVMTSIQRYLPSSNTQAFSIRDNRAGYAEVNTNVSGGDIHKSAMLAELQRQAMMSKIAGGWMPHEVALYAEGQMALYNEAVASKAEIEGLLSTNISPSDKTKLNEILVKINAIVDDKAGNYDAWQEGGEKRIAMHAQIGYLLTGSTKGAEAAATLAALAPKMKGAREPLSPKEQKLFNLVKALKIGDSQGSLEGVAGANIHWNNEMGDSDGDDTDAGYEDGGGSGSSYGMGGNSGGSSSSGGSNNDDDNDNDDGSGNSTPSYSEVDYTSLDTDKFFDDYDFTYNGINAPARGQVTGSVGVGSSSWSTSGLRNYGLGAGINYGSYVSSTTEVFSEANNHLANNTDYLSNLNYTSSHIVDSPTKQINYSAGEQAINSSHTVYLGDNTAHLATEGFSSSSPITLGTNQINFENTPSVKSSFVLNTGVQNRPYLSQLDPFGINYGSGLGSGNRGMNDYGQDQLVQENTTTKNKVTGNEIAENWANSQLAVLNTMQGLANAIEITNAFDVNKKNRDNLYAFVSGKVHNGIDTAEQAAAAQNIAGYASYVYYNAAASLARNNPEVYELEFAIDRLRNLTPYIKMHQISPEAKAVGEKLLATGLGGLAILAAEPIAMGCAANPGGCIMTTTDMLAGEAIGGASIAMGGAAVGKVVKEGIGAAAVRGADDAATVVSRRTQELAELFNKNNPRSGVQVGNRTLVEMPNTGSAKIFSGASEREVKTYFEQLTGSSLPTPRVIPDKGLIYVVKAPQGGNFMLREYSSSVEKTGPVWTIDVPKSVLGNTNKYEIKFMRD